MAKLTDIQIRAWIKSGEHFDGRSDGDWLYLCFPKNYSIPFWRLRYRFAGKQCSLVTGTYSELSLAKARAKEQSARVTLGYDVAGEKQQRKAEALRKMKKEKHALRVSELADEYVERQILNRWKHPDILRRRIDKDMNPAIDRLRIEDVKPGHIDDMLQKIIQRGAPTVSNDVLRWARRIFDYGIRCHMLETNPAGAFEIDDSGGQEKSRKRWLSCEELVRFLQAMPMTKGSSGQNELTMKLLLVFCCRKMELCDARWEEFDFDEAVWRLPAEWIKNGDTIDIPIPALALEWLKELHQMSCNGQWMLAARKMQHRMIPPIQESTRPVALSKVKGNLPDVPNFTIHDFRRTTHSHLAALRVDPVVAERCLNHRIKGVEGIYNRYQYFDEIKQALEFVG